MKKNLFFVFLSIFIFSLECVFAQKKPVTVTNLEKNSDKDGELSLHFVGDLMGHSPLFKFAEKSEGGFDFFPYFEPVYDALCEADITVGNLETVMAGKTRDYSGYPAFNTPNEYADALKKTGFDFLVTANNHSYDRGEAGVLRTLNELQKRNFYTFGTYRNIEERDSVRLFSAENIIFTVLAYTQFSNIKVPSEKPYLVNIYHENLVKRQIAAARKAGAEIVIVHYHWGNEYQKEPNFVQKEMTQTAIEAGADIIVADHPHVLQPFDLKKAAATATLDSVFIAYSLGNFISNQQWRYSDAGVILRLGLTKNGGKIKLSSREYVPTWVFKGLEKGKSTFRILPSQYMRDKLPEGLKEKITHFDILGLEHRRRMKEALSDTDLILAKYGKFAGERYWYTEKRKKTQMLIFEKKPFLLPVDFRTQEANLDRIKTPVVVKRKKFLGLF